MHSLLMLHGLTGDSDMMMEFATKICPENCNLIVPDAPFKHEKRGYCWWEYSEGVVNEKTRSEIQHSIQFLERVIPKEGKIIIGGFSQGAAMAQIMLLSEIRERISGMILLGTRGINDVHLSTVGRFTTASALEQRKTRGSTPTRPDFLTFTRICRKNVIYSL